MAFHLFDIREIYSNANGSVQYIELVTIHPNERFLTGHSITVTNGDTTNRFVFLTDLPGGTANKSFLIATQGFADLNLVIPDYIVPDGFLFPAGGTINFGEEVDILPYTALPLDGSNSLNRVDASTSELISGVSSPQNFAGSTGSIDTVGSGAVFTGTAGANTLNGAATNDGLFGAAGHDVLNGGAGNDHLNGGTGNDRLNGGAGNDVMIGAAGNDTFVRDATGDVLTEAANGGTDLVQSSLGYTLGTHFENLTLTGTGTINGTGNPLGNILTGNSGVNVLSGLAGNDKLNGGAGADNLNGGTGSDTLIWDATDTRMDGGASTGTDTLRILAAGNLNLTTSDDRIVNIEKIEMTNGIKNTLTLNKTEVLDMSTTSNTLTVMGNSTDVVNLKGAFVRTSTAGTLDTWKLGAAIVKIDEELTVI